MLNQQQATGQTDSQLQKQRITVMGSIESKKMENDKISFNDWESTDK